MPLPVPSPNPSAALAFLRAWQPPPWALVSIEVVEAGDARPHAVALTSGDEDRVRAFLDRQHDRGWNIYFTVNQPVPDIRTTPTKSEVARALGLHVDFDLPKVGPHSPPTEANLALLRERLTLLSPPPTAVVFSGGGYQALWKFADPVDLPPADGTNLSLERIEVENRAIQDSLGADHCWNVNRLFRLPGTVNFPNPAKRARGRVPTLALLDDELTEWARLYEFGVVHRRVHDAAASYEDEEDDDGPNQPPADAGSESRSRSRSRSSQRHTIDPLDDETSSGSSLVDLPQKLQKTIRDGDPRDWDGDRSRMVYSVICALVRRSWADDAIAQFFTGTGYGIAAHVHAQTNPRVYLRRQLERARNAVQSDWQRDSMNQINRHSQKNVRRALAEIGAKFSYDTFALRSYVNGVGPLRVISDSTMIDLRLSVDDRFGFLPEKELFGDVISHLCRAAEFHPILRWLDSLEWDGVERLGRPDAVPLDGEDDEEPLPSAQPPARPRPALTVPQFDDPIVDPEPASTPPAPATDTSRDSRVDAGVPSWLTTYGQAEDSAYTRIVGRIFLVAACRRLLEPGCKFDEMLVLVNPVQGTDKSSALQTLATKLEWFSDSVPLGATDKQVIERLSGKWIVEASDLSGMHRAEVNELKDFLSKRVDSDRLAYDRYRTELPRQCVFFGTTNTEVFLKDDQNRRFWPVQVGRFDVTRLQRDVAQLWAEAYKLAKDGESIRLHRRYWNLAAHHQDAARAVEPWAEILADAFTDANGAPINGRVVNTDVWLIVGKPYYQRNQEDNRRIGQAMKEIGFVRTRAGGGGLDRVRIVYERGETQAERRRLLYVLVDNLTHHVTVTPDPAGSVHAWFGEEPANGAEEGPPLREDPPQPRSPDFELR